MILTSTAIAAILFAQQRMSDPSTWWSADAYPAAAVAAGESGSVTVVFDIGHDGRARDCEVVMSPSDRLGDATCDLVEENARYAPIALGEAPSDRPGRGRGRGRGGGQERQGSVSQSTAILRDRITAEWTLDDGGPDVSFETDYGGAMPVSSPRGWVVAGELPPDEVDRTSPGRVAVAFRIGSDGRAFACRASTPSGSSAIDRQVCSQIEQRARFEAPVDRTGQRFGTEGRTTVIWCSTQGDSC